MMASKSQGSIPGCLNPDVLWSQRPESVRITFNLQDLSGVKVEADEDKLNFSGRSGGKDYAVELEFFDKVDPESLQETHTDRCHVCVLMKKNKDSKESWPRLLSTTVKQHWLRVDFSTWKDPDEDEDEDLSKMYPGPDMESYGNMGMNFDDFNPSGNSDGENADESSSMKSSDSEVETPANTPEYEVESANNNKEQEVNMNEPVSAK